MQSTYLTPSTHRTPFVFAPVPNLILFDPAFFAGFSSIWNGSYLVASTRTAGIASLSSRVGLGSTYLGVRGFDANVELK